MANLWNLLHPKILTLLRPGKGGLIQSKLALFFFAALGLLFWIGIYAASVWLCKRCLEIEDIGEILLQKILSMAFLTFFSILVFSNLVAAFTTFFLSDDLHLLNSSPIRPWTLFSARLLETIFHASWMILIFGTPLLMAYGKTFNAGGLYYVAILGIFLPFLLIPAALAVFFALLLATAFPARRIRDLFFFLAVLGFAGLYLYFRLLQPERFLDPDRFTDTLQFLAMLRNPTSVWLPSDWAVAGLFPLLSRQGLQAHPIYWFALYSTAAALVVLCFWFYEAFYPEAYSRSLVGRKLKARMDRFLQGLLRLLSWHSSPIQASMFEKEFKTFVRSPGQWAQLLMLGALIVVYVFNFSSLRQASTAQMHGVPTHFAAMGLYLFNLGLLGFVITAVSVRFAFPAVSLEGKAFWLIRQSPVPMHRFLLAKFWSLWLPLTLLAQCIALSTNLFLRASLAHTLLAVITVFLMTLALVGMGVGFGALYPRFDIENPAKIATGFGGVLYMILSMLWITLVLSLQVIPLRYLLLNRLHSHPFTPSQIAYSSLVFAAILLLTLFAWRAPLRAGARYLESRE